MALEKIVSNNETLQDFLVRCLTSLGATTSIKEEYGDWFITVHGLWGINIEDMWMGWYHNLNAVSTGSVFWYDTREKFAYFVNKEERYQFIIGDGYYDSDNVFLQRSIFLIDTFIVNGVEKLDILPGGSTSGACDEKLAEAPYYTRQGVRGDTSNVTNIRKTLDNVKFKPDELHIVPLHIGFAESKHLYTPLNGFALMGDTIHGSGHEYMCLDSQIFYRMD